jgi:hypothetical protein
MSGLRPEDTNTFIEQQLDNYIGDLRTKLNADVISFSGPILSMIDDFLRDAIESIESKNEKLAVILQTSGGSIEVAERIANLFRFHYKYVDFIIPSHAMSAGTVLVMSGDDIYMDYYSILGPIDPQIEKAGTNALIPALGYLTYFERLVEKSREGTLTTAELAYLIQKFDAAELYQFEQAKALSQTLLVDWLVRYKFKNWTETETRKIPVTQTMKESRAEEIAKLLSNADEWHSHSRGISLAVLREKVKLIIKDYGEDTDLKTKVSKYYRLLSDYVARRGHQIIVHTKGRYNQLF